MSVGRIPETKTSTPPEVGAASAGSDEVAGEESGTRPEQVFGKLPRRSRTLRPSRLWGIRQDVPGPARLTLVAIGVLTPLLVWWALTASQLVDPVFLPSPGDVLRSGRELIASGELVADALATLRRVALGFGLAILVSVPLGLLIGSFRAGEALFEPLLALLRYLPASAFIPLLLIWLGIGEPSKVGLLFIGTVFFNTLMTADVVRLVPRELIQVSYTLGANRREVLRKVIFPHALPGMIDAMRVNAAAAWNFVVVAELVASTSGLGYRIVRSQRFLQTGRIFAVLIVIGLIGLAIDLSFRRLRNSVAGWAA
jgi:NitT/TauT family transport system permease protein